MHDQWGQVYTVACDSGETTCVTAPGTIGGGEDGALGFRRQGAPDFPLACPWHAPDFPLACMTFP